MHYLNSDSALTVRRMALVLPIAATELAPITQLIDFSRSDERRLGSGARRRAWAAPVGARMGRTGVRSGGSGRTGWPPQAGPQRISRDLAVMLNGDGGRQTCLQDRDRGGRAVIADRGWEQRSSRNNDPRSCD